MLKILLYTVVCCCILCILKEWPDSGLTGLTDIQQQGLKISEIDKKSTEELWAVCAASTKSAKKLPGDVAFGKGY